MTDSLGSLTSVNYAPYGQTFSGSTSDAFGFTGLQSDATTALYHATFRQFSSQQGRWQSPDPYAGSYDWSDPQSLNRYAYVNGRPMFGTDPSGLFTDGAVDPDYVPPSIWATIGPIAPPVAIFGAMLDIADLVTDLLNRTDFHGSIQPRPSAGVWNDKFGVPYGGLTNGIQQALGLPTMSDISPIFDATAGNRSGFESLFCLGDALKSNGVSLALDAVGLIPAGGSASAAFSLFHGAAGVSNGTNILNRVKMGAGIIGTAGSGASNNWLGIATGAASIGASLGKAAPVYGQVLSLGALGVDAYKTYKAQSACVDSGKYD
jgi:RHS repeat-associated protein